jgi:hypothetical protein
MDTNCRWCGQRDDAGLNHLFPPLSRKAEIRSVLRRGLLGRLLKRAREDRTSDLRSRDRRSKPRKPQCSPGFSYAPKGFEPLIFGSVVGDSTGPRGLFPRRIVCTARFLVMTREATRGAICSHLVPTRRRLPAYSGGRRSARDFASQGTGVPEVPAHLAATPHGPSPGPRRPWSAGCRRARPPRRSVPR